MDKMLRIQACYEQIADAEKSILAHSIADIRDEPNGESFSSQIIEFNQALILENKKELHELTSLL